MFPDGRTDAAGVDTGGFENVSESNYTRGSAKAQHVADATSEALLALGRSGNPNCAANPAWPKFDAEKRPTMIFDLPTRLENDPRGKERKLFASIVYVQAGT